jgi:hypothetical protein
LKSPRDRLGAGVRLLEVPATLLARTDEVIEWGADCCGASVHNGMQRRFAAMQHRAGNGGQRRRSHADFGPNA